MSLKYRIVLVPFPFDDFSSTKVRPALCLTEPIGRYRHVLIAFITSRLPEIPEVSDVALTPDQPGFPGTGLRVPSAIRLHRVVTVTESLIQRDLGELPDALKIEVQSQLKAMLL